jgi:hypothetical protein
VIEGLQAKRPAAPPVEVLRRRAALRTFITLFGRTTGIGAEGISASAALRKPAIPSSIST